VRRVASMTPHLAWVSFDVHRLGPLPDGLEVEEYAGGPLPDSADRVELFVPPYDTDLDLSELLPRLPALRVVQTQTAGVDNIEAHVPAGVTLCNARGVHDASTAELAVGLVLASLRGLPDFVRAAATGEWARSPRPSLADRRVLVVGYGSIGAALERRLDGFECEVVRVARTAREGVHGWEELPELLPHADVVVLLVPLTDQTRGLVDRDFLAALPDGALLVNVARGPVVDTDALVAECASGRLQAALDVTDPEPLPPEHPLWRTPGVLISPHVGGATSAMQPRMLALVDEQLRRFAAGEPLLNVVRAD
jgi:phosphoglycerate dehydrogenase-like enzyme